MVSPIEKREDEKIELQINLGFFGNKLQILKAVAVNFLCQFFFHAHHEGFSLFYKRNLLIRFSC
jgi:hypothetical protein